MEYINKSHRKLVAVQAIDLVKHGKKPTIKDPYLTFLYEFYKNSIMVQILKETKTWPLKT